MGVDDRYVWTASSLGGNPVSCSASLAALSIYRQSGVHEQKEIVGLRVFLSHLVTVGTLWGRVLNGLK